MDDGVIIAAPPCSLYGPACSSAHKRSPENVRGDMQNFKVRLAHRIWTNFVPWQIHANSVRPDMSYKMQGSKENSIEWQVYLIRYHCLKDEKIFAYTCI